MKNLNYLPSEEIDLTYPPEPSIEDMVDQIDTIFDFLFVDETGDEPER